MKTIYSLMTMLTVVGISAGVAGVACGAEKAGRMTPAATVEKDTKRAKAGDTSKDDKTAKAKAEKASGKAAVKPAKKDKDGKRQATDGKRAQVGTQSESRGKKA